MTLIIKRIVTYTWPQIGISLTHQIILTVLILFYHLQDNVTVSMTYTPIIANRPRAVVYVRETDCCLTLRVRHIVAYA